MMKVRAILKDGSTEYIETVKDKQINYLVLEKDRLPYITIDVRNKIPILYIRRVFSIEGIHIKDTFYLGYYDQGVKFLLSCSNTGIRVEDDIIRTSNSVS